MRFYFAGHSNFGNRGCEALVRSSVQLLEEQFGKIEVLVPSYNAAADARQWPEHAEHGVRFVRAPELPTGILWWHRFARLAPALKNLWLPGYHVPADIEAEIDTVDAIIMIGGDVITLDYGLVSLLWHVGLANHFRMKGKPVMLWGCSTGPFTAEPAVERFMTTFLRSLDAVTVRETITKSYLDRLGVTDNVSVVADPAFVLEPQAIDCTFLPPESVDGLLGLNVSPLIAKFRPQGEDPKVMQSELARFIDATLDSSSLSILLLPHVDSIDGTVESNNSDSGYMREVLAMVKDPRDRVVMAPPGLNAAQLKHLLGRCRYFIGARTHATIGAISRGVPTISIAYSVKARGLNRDLFGDERFVLETPKVSASTLAESLATLRRDEPMIRESLASLMTLWKERTRVSAQVLADVLDNRLVSKREAA